MFLSISTREPAFKSSLLCLVHILIAVTIHATVKPNSLFSSNMVLQQGKPVPVWGTAPDGESVTVFFEGKEYRTTAIGSRWKIELFSLRANDKGQTMTIRGKDTTISITNILIGEVWLCSGQSNMYRTLGPQPSRPDITNWMEEKDNANYPLIRQYTVPMLYAATKTDDANGNWKICSPETVSTFSAVGYFFARDLHKDVKVPVGIILSAFGGTPAEDWTSRDALNADPELKKFADHYVEIVSAAYQPKGQLISGLYNGMVHPLIPYGIAGIAWYQGEANNVRVHQYELVLSNLINSWRSDLMQGELPFLIVQIAPHKDMSPELREAQLKVSQRTTNTALIVTTDCGDAEDIHPAYKQPVGERLARAALALAYHKQLVYAGPALRSWKIRGSRIMLRFKNSRHGLKTIDGQPLKGFTIAGNDHVFIPARVLLKKRSIIVYHPGGHKPTAVRYGWSNTPEVNLCNNEGLPASPFRTDGSRN
ncbi:sialate O-acetylesterase [Terrimonas sp. NA20]|uniref:Sialate O-acetylesterase n=1 Tax=Terrimonas ginsenosidimutans TaxID=2908004 RepID=A0ABS9KT47_9BACT|nr:sialate O-acetylesterase [Terrimonas ginsenosidimutans]MCG2615467.1 sialate O-acetylesterase [Terrimonas ginsenosidimutans]